ncbi:hypothetical protein MLD38_016376 [Melastoma candidum]|uniref:Uncharacterized protein n=1 Tax=Melastoma candidum TaxID=119954 RepID=A0ACB9RKI7_9MYRT|nr:hypothetical protein MLD38_016376 [Melastoma candidum]
MDVPGDPKTGQPSAEEEGTTTTWLRKHRHLYTAATRHPLILSIRDGTVDLDSFRRWLGQDYLFVRAFTAFLSSVLMKAWKQSGDESSDLEVLLGGLSALRDEIAWFQEEATRWGIGLSGIVPREITRGYIRFLEELMKPDMEYATVATALWAIETVYQQSFAFCLEEGSAIRPELVGACERWGNNAFGQYCHELQRIADCQLTKASKDDLERAESAFLRVLEHEVKFWEMCHEDL